MRHSSSPEIKLFFLNWSTYDTPVTMFQYFYFCNLPSNSCWNKKKIMRLLWNSVISYLLRLIRLCRTWREIKFSQIIHPSRSIFTFQLIKSVNPSFTVLYLRPQRENSLQFNQPQFGLLSFIIMKLIILCDKLFESRVSICIAWVVFIFFLYVSSFRLGC